MHADPTTVPEAEPWVEIESLIEAGDTAALRAAVAELPATVAALTLSRLDADERQSLILALDPKAAAEMLADVTEEQAVEVLAELPTGAAAAIVSLLPSDEQADLLGELHDDEILQGILDQLPADDAQDARMLLEYPWDTAGGIMITEYVTYEARQVVSEVVADLQDNREAYADYQVQYLYVVDTGGKLLGVLPTRDLLFTPREQPIDSVMRSPSLSVPVTATLLDLHDFFEEHDFFGVPVVNEAGQMVGVVEQTSVREHEHVLAVERERAARGIVGGEEFRSMPMLLRSRRRLSWLSLNIVLNIFAAAIIAIYQDTLAAAIALAVFLPMISDMSGCSGNQAVAVSLRELSLGLVRPTELIRVLRKEAVLGVINGTTLGVLLGCVAGVYGYFTGDAGAAMLGVVVGLALAINTVVAVCFGGMLPLFIQRLKLDPALVSGPMLTTVTDMCGFFLVFSLATLLLV